MIFVTVGTESYPFNSLMEWIDILIGYGILNEEIVVQYGSSTKLPNGVKVYKSLPEKDFQLLIEKSRLTIAHCGEGTALLLASLNKPYVLVPRLSKYGEHVDDHQLELAHALEQKGVQIARSPADLVKFIKSVEQSIPNDIQVEWQEQDEALTSITAPYSSIPRLELSYLATEFSSRKQASQSQAIGVATTYPSSTVLLEERPKEPNRIKLGIKLPELNPIAEYLRQHYSQISRLMLVCSSGGHYKALQELSPYYMSSPHTSWVTFQNQTTQAELQGSNVYWAHSPTNRNLPNLIRNFFLSFQVLRKEKPEVVLSTGAGVAVPFLILAKYLYRSRTIFVESKTRVQELSLSAKLLQACGALDELIVQSQELSHCHPNVRYVSDAEYDLTSN